MAAPDNSTYILASPDGSLTNSRTLSTGNPETTNLLLNLSSQQAIIMPVLNLGALASYSEQGLMTYVGNNDFQPTSIISSDDSINITNPNGVLGNIDLTIGNINVPCPINVYNNASLVGSQDTLNFIPGDNITISAINDVNNNRVTLSISATPPASAAANWSLYPALQDVNIASNAINNVGSLIFTLTDIPTVTGTEGILSYSTGQLPYWSSNLTGSHIIATVIPNGNFARVGSLLIGNGVDYTSVPAPSTAGMLFTSNGATQSPSWQAAPSNLNWWSTSIGGGANPYLAFAMDCNSQDINRCGSMNINGVLSFSNTPLTNSPIGYTVPVLGNLNNRLYLANGTPDNKAYVVGVNSALVTAEQYGALNCFVVGSPTNFGGYTHFAPPDSLPPIGQYDYLVYQRSGSDGIYAWKRASAEPPESSGSVVLANTTVDGVELGDGTAFIEDENITVNTVIQVVPTGIYGGLGAPDGPISIRLNTNLSTGLPLGIVLIGDGANDNGKRVGYTIMRYDV